MTRTGRHRWWVQYTVFCYVALLGLLGAGALLFDVVASVSSDPDVLVARARAEGVLIGSLGNGKVRLVTHLDVDRAGCERAVEVLRRVA